MSKNYQTERQIIPLVAHESDMSRMERQLKRLWIIILVLIGLLFATNLMWVIYECQYSTISYEQDGEGLNNINTGTQGDIFGAESENKVPQESHASTGSESS